jgi:hypothetical protein
MTGTVQYAKQHGVYKIGPGNQGCLLDIVYQGDQFAIKSCAREDGSVALVSNIGKLDELEIKPNGLKVKS